MACTRDCFRFPRTTRPSKPRARRSREWERPICRERRERSRSTRTIRIGRQDRLGRHHRARHRCAMASVRSRITGPPNALLKTSPNVRRRISKCWSIRENPVALVRVGDDRLLLQARRMERVAAGAASISCRNRLQRQRHGALLPEAGPAAPHALHDAGEHRPARSRAGDRSAREVCVRARRRRRAVLHGGDAGRHEGAARRRAHAARVPDAVAARAGRAQAAARCGAAPLRERAGSLAHVLLLQQHRSAASHAVSRGRSDRSAAPGGHARPTRRTRCATRIDRSTSRSAR